MKKTTDARMAYQHPILVPGAQGHGDPAALRAVIEESAYRPTPRSVDTIEFLIDEIENTLGILDAVIAHFEDAAERDRMFKIARSALRDAIVELEGLLEVER